MPGPISVRFAGSEDLSWCGSQDESLDQEVLERKIPWKELPIAELAGKMVGYLRLEYLWSKIPYIGLVKVNQEQRGQGVGRAMLRFLEEFLHENEFRVLMSSSQVNEPRAQEWHRKMEFQESGIVVGINKGGIGEIFFTKPL